MNPTDRTMRLLLKRIEELEKKVERLERFQGDEFIERKYEEKGEFPKYDGDGKRLSRNPVLKSDDVDIHGNTWIGGNKSHNPFGELLDESENH